MKPLAQQLLFGLVGCMILTVLLGYGLSIAVNYGIARFEQQANEFLPIQ